MNRQERRRLATSISVLASVAVVLLPAQAAHAAYRSDTTLGASAQYDYAWITDNNNDCGFMGVRHYYYPSGPGMYTQWVTGYLYHYESPRAPQLSYGQWAF